MYGSKAPINQFTVDTFYLESMHTMHHLLEVAYLLGFIGAYFVFEVCTNYAPNAQNMHQMPKTPLNLEKLGKTKRGQT